MTCTCHTRVCGNHTCTTVPIMHMCVYRHPGNSVHPYPHACVHAYWIMCVHMYVPCTSVCTRMSPYPCLCMHMHHYNITLDASGFSSPPVFSWVSEWLHQAQTLPWVWRIPLLKIHPCCCCCCSELGPCGVGSPHRRWLGGWEQLHQAGVAFPAETAERWLLR